MSEQTVKGEWTVKEVTSGKVVNLWIYKGEKRVANFGAVKERVKTERGDEWVETKDAIFIRNTATMMAAADDMVDGLKLGLWWIRHAANQDEKNTAVQVSCKALERAGFPELAKG